MSTSVLLVNFTRAQAEKVQKNLPVKVERGFISDGIERKNSKGEVNMLPNTDIPPIYEHGVTFINLANIKGLQAEFKAEDFDLRELLNLSKYWNERIGTLIFLLGDYTYSDMLSLGVEDVRLSTANRRDNKVKFISAKEDANLNAVFKDLKSTIKYPLSHYIEPSGRWLKDIYGEPEMRKIYTNLNDDCIGVYVDYANRFDRDELDPGLIILPQYTDNATAVIKIIRGLSKDNEKLIPEITEQDWASSDQLYPKEIASIDTLIDRAVEDARAKINVLRDNKSKIKDSYSFMPTLLTGQHDELKQAVIAALDFLGLTVTDVDKEANGKYAEDILIEAGELKVLAEVKGTKSKTPQDIYIGQVWKHIAQSEIEGLKTGALILNHDLNTEPKSRPEAYTGDKEKELNDIIYIDTRELHKLLLQVIDESKDKAEATNSLLNKGRFKVKTSIGHKE